MSGDPAHLHTGRLGEDAAERFLREQGWLVLDRNWRQGRLELDLVCKDKDCLVFVEVKTRSARGMTCPADAFTLAKRRSVVRAARAWLGQHNAWSLPCRFDLVNVTRQGDSNSLELVRHVIELGSVHGLSLGGGHTAWQPW